MKPVDDTRSRLMPSLRLLIAREWNRLHVVFLVVVISIAGMSSASAQVAGLSYTGAPSGEYVLWDDNAAINNGFMYGGKLGIGFGEYIELRGLYLLGRGFRTDYSDLTVEDNDLFQALQSITGRPLHVQRYGTQLQVNMARAGIIPFVQAGTGIIQFQPQAVEGFGQPERSQNIYADLGAGVVYQMSPRLTLSLSGQALGYQYNPASTFLTDEDLTALSEETAAPVTRDDFQPQRVLNPSVSAAVTVHLGGRARGELTDADEAFLRQFGRGGLSLSVEPFYGRIDFSDALAFPARQYVTGINAGLDFGPFVGLHAFYWRATDLDQMFDGAIGDWFQQLQFFGGELELRMGQEFARGVTPFLRVGGGYVNVGANFLGPDEQVVDSRYFASGGAGLDVPLSDRFGLRGGVRGLLMSENAIEDVAEAGSVHANWMYTLGITFNVGRTPATPDDMLAEELQPVEEEEPDELPDLLAEREPDAAEHIAHLEATIDSLLQRQQELEALLLDDVRDPEDILLDAEEREEPPRRVRYISDREIVIPIPEEGEIYLRYGPDQAPAAQPQMAFPPQAEGWMMGIQPGAALDLDEEQIQQIVDVIVEERMAQVEEGQLVGGMTATEARLFIQDVVREQVQQAQLAGLPTDEEMRSIVTEIVQDQLRGLQPDTITEAELQNLIRRLDRMDQMLARELERMRTEVQARPPDRVTDPDSRSRFEERGASISRPFGRGLSAIQPFTGVRGGDGPTQWLMGLRADFRDPQRLIRFAPEGAFGFGNGTSINVLANGLIPLPMPMVEEVTPYVGPGVGFISDSGFSGLQFVFNLVGGAEYVLPTGHVIFLEYNSQNFFDVHRVVGGMRIGF